jgi:Membrane-bound lysozyme-inhibitor of c-type lysozyme
MTLFSNKTSAALLVTLGILSACSSSPKQPASPVVAPPKPVATAPAPAPAPAPVAMAPTPAPAAAQPVTAPVQAKAAAPEASTAKMVLETGLHRCELGQRVTVKRIAPDKSNILLNWSGKDYTMKAVGTESGALRFEDKASGLVWMAIVGKSQLLNSKRGQRLANECNL